MSAPFLPEMPSANSIVASLTQRFEDPEKARAFYVPVLSCVLTQITERNDRISLDKQSVTIFHALKAPGICVRSYMDRLVKYSHCTPECFVLALIYLDRVIHRNPGFVISTLNIHRLLVTSLMTAAKFFDDIYYNNGYYARVGGVSNQEMNALELEFLYMINFSLHVTVEEFERYQQELLVHASNSQVCHCAQEAEVQCACQSVCEDAMAMDQKCCMDLEDLEEGMADVSMEEECAATAAAVEEEEEEDDDRLQQQLGRDISRSTSASSVESYNSLDSRNSSDFSCCSDVLVHARPISSSAPSSRLPSPALPEKEMVDGTTTECGSFRQCSSSTNGDMMMFQKDNMHVPFPHRQRATFATGH